MPLDQTFLTTLNQLALGSPASTSLAVLAAVPLIWVLFGWYLVAFVWHKRGGLRELLALFTGAGAGYLATALISQWWFRLRPFVAESATLLISEPGSLKSFPSDHATAAFFLAVLLTAHRPGWWWSFLIAAAVAAGRVAVGVHYPTDVIAGALLGTVFGLATIWIEDMLSRRSSLPRSSGG